MRVIIFVSKETQEILKANEGFLRKLKLIFFILIIYLNEEFIPKED